MTSASNYLEEKLVDQVFRSSSFVKPTTLAIALCTAPTVDSDNGSTITEVVNSLGYSRQVLNPSDANWAANSNGQTYNLVEITFGPALGSWGIITHVAILDNSNYGTGNVLVHGPIDDTVSISQNNVFSFPIGNLRVTFQ